METLQNNFTTPEQSKRLLELGVPVDSADFYYSEFTSEADIVGPLVINCSTFTEEQNFFPLDKMLPCWSVGRLMEIAHICSDSTLSYKEEAIEIQKFKEDHKCETLIEAVIVCITDAVSIGSIDFSKLEK